MVNECIIIFCLRCQRTHAETGKLSSSLNISFHLLAVLCTDEASNGAEVVEVCAV